MNDATQHQIGLLQHALGINENRREPYRNYFLASGVHSDNADLESLVTAGLMTSRAAPSFCAEDDVVYHVTDAGREMAVAALPAPKKRTRYDEYLRSEVCESFGEWLGINLPQYEYRKEFGKRQYRMTRRSRFYGCDGVNGQWCATKKEAKASYKDALKADKAYWEAV
ncbi:MULTISPECIES: hypothetical protein [Rahnella]|uniref:Uncharacterized protein n=1 Tax=Rahnella laticis TaxID=2787622 RepID=A0ABS0E0I5_9GAMM|nr:MULTISPECIES: hypothetical protein [Rahnella]MBF7978608.1 hypothetical protein [Rahnella laticis]MBF7998698.1 hypothetical protein [Rahnella sp. LAC-M12]